MTKRIFKYTELVVTICLLTGFVFILGILYRYFGSTHLKQLKTETSLAAEAVQKQGLDYLRDLDLSDTRVTWISADGTVLFDNESDPEEMDNHANRPEFMDAVKSGSGESSRYSKTLTREMIYSAKRLDDGSVLRLAESRRTVFSVAMGMMIPMMRLFIILLIITWLLSSHFSRKIVGPLNTLDLDHPEENDIYDEITPLLERIYRQQRKITSQEKKLQKLEKDFRTVTDNMGEGLILLNEKGLVLSINQKAADLLHVKNECIGRDMLTLERRSAFLRIFHEASAGRQGGDILTYGGRQYHVDVNPVASDDRNNAGMVILMYDVTERENAEAMRREFSGNVSHELKTPLHTISGCAELLEHGNVRTEDQKKFVHVIYTEAQRMVSLVEDILYISHLDEGAVDLKPEMLDLYQMAEQTIAHLKKEADQKKVAVLLHGEAAPLPGIRRLTDSIVFNLIDNAVKYNKDGGRVDVTVRPEGSQVVFIVQDTGIGIPEEDRERIFERFYRVDKSHSRAIGGTGLGLSIVKHAAILQHAKVSVVSKPDEGSTFTVVFPAGEELMETESAEEAFA